MNDPQLKKYFKYVLVLSSFGIIFLIGFLVGKIDISDSDMGHENGQFLYGDFSGDKVGVDVDVLWEAWGKLEDYYIDNTQLDKSEMLYGAVEGMVESLDDPYTQYLSPKETASYLQSSGGKFEGIGAFLRYNGEYTVIDSPIDDLPAQKAGLMAGDVILEVDGEDVKGKGAFEVAEIIKGPSNTDVTLKIYRPQDQEEMSFTITRAPIDIDNIKLEEVRNDTAVIKLYKFNESDDSEFMNQWNEVVSKVLEKDLNNIIVDLRNNPGGRVDYVKYVTEEFLSKGDVIMMEEDRDGNKRSFVSSRDGLLRNKKIYVLINEGSASASEIMSGALRDNDVALLVGMPTVGKGVEQTVVELSDGSTMHIVFKRWLLPSGEQVSPDSPIKPDVEVDLTTEDFEKGRDPQIDKVWDKINE